MMPYRQHALPIKPQLHGVTRDAKRQRQIGPHFWCNCCWNCRRVRCDREQLAAFSVDCWWSVRRVRSDWIDSFGKRSNTEQTQVAASVYFLSALGLSSPRNQCWARAAPGAFYMILPTSRGCEQFFLAIKDECSLLRHCVLSTQPSVQRYRWRSLCCVTVTQLRSDNVPTALPLQRGMTRVPAQRATVAHPWYAGLPFSS